MLKVFDFIVDNAVYGENPRFCWKLDSNQKNVKQTAYRLCVFEGDSVVYDSKLKRDQQSLYVEAAIKLRAETQYCAKVTVQDNVGEEACAEVSFQTAIQSFGGEFIAPDVVPVPNACVLFTEFEVGQGVKSAFLYITALGVYEAFINQHRVGKDYLAPFWTSYDKLLEFQSYDVTHLLSEKNVIEVLLGKGWCRGKIGNYREGNRYAEESALLAELHICYADGRKQVLTTDKRWKAANGFVVESELYFGEEQDFTRAQTEWRVKEIPYDKSVLTPQINEPIRIFKELKPISCFCTPKGETVLDFGVNVSGVVKLKICGARGQKVSVSHAEILDTEGNFYTENLRDATSLNSFILAGGEQELYPHFIYHGFRYVKIEGVEKVNPNDFTAVVLMSYMKETGHIKTDHEGINTLIENIKRGQRGNFLDVPTDCPQRDERLGWTGDANVFARSAAYNYNVALFFRKWLQDLNLSQEPDGCIPRVVPPYIKGGGRTIALWGDSVTMIPQTMYWMYGDKKYLSNSYDAMKKYVDCLEGRKKQDGLIETICYGDWLSLDKDPLFCSKLFSDLCGGTDEKYISNVFYCLSLKILFESGKLLKKGEYKQYKKEYKEHLRRIRKEYFTCTGRLTEATQTGCVLALKFGIAPQRFRYRVMEQLKKNLENHLDRLTTGFVGTPFLLPVLAENGLSNKAMKILLNKEYPGWLYEVDRGATTVWERWNGIMPNGQLYDPSMNSFNHYAYGSVIEFLYEKIGGISPLEVGFKKILIQPLLENNSFGSVEMRYDSVYGDIHCRYAKDEKAAEIWIKIPCNTSAEVRLPNQAPFTVGSGEYHFTCVV